MMTFNEAFLCGTGVSLGFCVGLVAWIFLKQASYWILGIHKMVEENRQHGLECLGALLQRNCLANVANGIRERIAVSLKAMEDDDNAGEEGKDGDDSDTDDTG